ncbi:hypothetical protein COU59_03190 [Candidatus Pacearchaeota archaeon CG10_big_fil_rev_8_21_14_0_10_34_12]|nr:MAG: hypothetical protein COU59_03190 [Candidatus Pacearchaeota archaeon CG10_big_fil_rev_8_21_14_0_10_34_12]
MFGKKECKSCGEKVNSKSKFCPNCGFSMTNKRTRKEDFGMLGKNDFMDEIENVSNSLFGGISGKVMGKMLENAMKMLEKEMKKGMDNENIRPKMNYELVINGKKVNLNPVQKESKPQKKVKETSLPKGILKKFSELKREEPKTDIRRFSDKIVYEISMPGVKSEKDISITKLENSIEIRAVTKDTSYQKVIPIDFPITDYNLSKGKLVLELGINE